MLQGLNSRLVQVTADSQLDAVANAQFATIPAGGGFTVTPVTNGETPSVNICLLCKISKRLPCLLHNAVLVGGSGRGSICKAHLQAQY